MTILFIFRRDLRNIDNVGLHKSIKLAKENNTDILCVFIFTPTQVTKNSYKSDAAVKFMIDSLDELSNDIDLSFFYGENEEVLDELFKSNDITHVVFNRDTTPYAIKRDSKINKLCKKHNIICDYEDNWDYNLHNITDPNIYTQGGKYYSVYTPFYNKAKQLNVNEPLKNPSFNKFIKKSNKYTITLDKARNMFIDLNKVPDLLVSGGRKHGLKLLNSSKKTQTNYDKTREISSKNTTLLSAHVKFGTLSIREIYHFFKKEKFNSLIAQLYWNEFYDSLLFHLPYDRTFGKSNFKQLNIKWKNNSSYFNAWKNGKTGFPYIDAGMRQLLAEGYMHNRARMAVANFLAFILHIDWRKGEKHFAQHLVDYDPAQNNGNWQWSAGVGVDRTSFLRIFNPYNQSLEHDPDCVYIKKYVHELKDVPIEHIHKWDKYHKEYSYINPIVDYSAERKVGASMYRP